MVKKKTFDLATLIEMCGDDFHDLTRTRKGWGCNQRLVSFENGEKRFLHETWGKLPEKAVMDLYLKYQKINSHE